tara:strand:+ start:596 stop:706 length:111 start_codon:yes stop_codon:yes gene_type:complete
MAKPGITGDGGGGEEVTLQPIFIGLSSLIQVQLVAN